MWKKTFSETYKNISEDKVWHCWSNVELWPKWNTKLEYCKPLSPFGKGCQFILKPKSGPKVKISIVDLKKGYFFTDCTKFLGAKMYGHHEIKKVGDEICFTTTISISGPISFFWRKVVAEKVAKSLQEETEKLAELCTIDE